jgi:dipeptidyl aminopeptidase/acylaminoacyl peptidase
MTKHIASTSLLVLSLATTALAAERYQPADRARIALPSDPQISPDAKSVALVVSRANTKDNRWEPELVVVDVATGALRPLAFDRRGVASPRWSPDGQRLAFLANASAEKDAKRQIWVMSMRGGDARRITEAGSGVQQLAWSPDGSQIAFVTADEGEKRPDADKNNRSFEIVDDDYLTTAAPTPSHVWVVSSDGGDARRVTSGAWSLPIAHPPGPAPSPLSWSRDGKTIAITRRDSPHSKTPDISHAALVDVATGETRRLTTHVVDDGQPVFSPEGTRIAYWYPQGGERSSQNASWVAPASGGDGREATGSIDRNVFRAVWLPDGKSFLTGGHDGTTTAYWIQPADGGPARRLDLGDVEPFWGFWIDASIAPSGAIAFTGSTPSHPRELYFMESLGDGAKPRVLTHLNDKVAALSLGRVESIGWKFEGMDQDGVVVYPPDFEASKKYPLVVYIHGGPRAASTKGFAPLPQVLAAQGWIVFQPNYRGSDNLGDAYTRAIVHDSGAGPGRDVMAGIEALAKRGSVDRDRVGVGGWSYGGYMTSWMIGHYPIFKAAVSGAAVNNLVDAYVLGDGGLSRRLTWGSPYTADNMKKYIEQSPITHAAKIKAPTLILSDTGDVRVPITQSFQMYHALKDNGVPVKFVAYPVGGHSPEDPAHQIDIDRRYVEWLAPYLK